MLVVVVVLRWMECLGVSGCVWVCLVCLGRATDMLGSDTGREHWRRRKAELTCQDGDRTLQGRKSILERIKKHIAFRRVVAVSEHQTPGS